MGPNAFHAFDALGVGKQARSKAVYTDYMVMHDAIDEQQVGYIPTGEAFRQRFGNPYAVIHRADAHMALYDGVKASDQVSFLTSTRIVRTEQSADSVTVHDQHGNAHHGQALIGADGVKSVVREQYVGDPAKVTGHVVYRAVVEKNEFPVDLQWNAASIWVGPNCHLVHYPLRGGEQYNVVVTFHSRQTEEWGVTDGSREEVLSYFQGICPKARQLLDMAQGGCMAMEDAVTLGEALRVTNKDWVSAFDLYQRSRVARTARIVLSAREMGRLFHVKDVERLVRNELWRGRTPERFYDALEWLYGWNVANCLAAH